MSSFHWLVAAVIVLTMVLAMLKIGGPLAGMSWLWLAAPAGFALAGVAILLMLIVYAVSRS